MRCILRACILLALLKKFCCDEIRPALYAPIPTAVNLVTVRPELNSNCSCLSGPMLRYLRKASKEAECLFHLDTGRMDACSVACWLHCRSHTLRKKTKQKQKNLYWVAVWQVCFQSLGAGGWTGYFNRAWRWSSKEKTSGDSSFAILWV